MSTNIDIQDQTGARLGGEKTFDRDRGFDRGFDRDYRRDFGDRFDQRDQFDRGVYDRGFDRGFDRDYRRDYGDYRGRDMDRGLGEDWRRGKRGPGRADYGYNMPRRDLGWDYGMYNLPMGRDMGRDMGGLGWGDMGGGRNLGLLSSSDLGLGTLGGMDWGMGWPEMGMGQDMGLGMGLPSLGYPGWGGMGVGGRRGIDESRYTRLPHYNKIIDNPNIDESTLWRPRADIFEEDQDTLRVEFELPGVPKEDISLTVQDNILTLAALKPQTRKEETGFHYQNERHFGKFYRRLMLPFVVDPNNVRAHMDNGVLKVHLTRMGGMGGRIPIAASEGGVGTSTGTPLRTSGAPQTQRT